MSRSIKTFEERLLIRHWNSEAVRIVEQHTQRADEQITEWLEANPAYQLETVQVDTQIQTIQNEQYLLRTYAVLYFLKEGVVKVPAEKVIPLIKGAVAPTIVAKRSAPDGVRSVQVMAGMFVAVEGDKFHPDDEQPAPVPLFSPEFDPRIYADHFGNVGAP